MTSDEKRSRIAENVRCAAETSSEEGGYVKGTLFGMDVYARSVEGMRCGLDALADLIDPKPERTCRMEYDPVHCDYVCTACGEWHNTGMYDACDADDMILLRPYRYCPKCGAKVVSE